MDITAAPQDPIDAVTHADPYRYYARLRAGPELAFDPRLRVWVASRAEVVHAVLADAAALRVRPLAEPVPGAIAGTPAGEVFGQLARMTDGPAHAIARSPLERALAGLDLQAVRADALRVARQLPPATLSDSAFALPVAAVAHLLGFADDALPGVVTWTRDFVACLSPLSTPEQLHAASAAASALRQRLEALARSGPAGANSLLAAVLAQAEGQRGSPAVQANLLGLLSQTCDATAGLVGNSLVALVREPGLMDALRAQPGAIDALVREVARHDAPVQNTRRFVAHAVEMAGVSLAPGDAVLLVLGACAAEIGARAGARGGASVGAAEAVWRATQRGGNDRWRCPWPRPFGLGLQDGACGVAGLAQAASLGCARRLACTALQAQRGSRFLPRRLLGAANRDPALNAEPDAFRLDRAHRRMLGFGHGAHACPGQALAFALAAAAVEALLARGDVDAAGLRRRGWHYRRSVNARIPVFH